MAGRRGRALIAAVGVAWPRRAGLGVADRAAAQGGRPAAGHGRRVRQPGLRRTTRRAPRSSCSWSSSRARSGSCATASRSAAVPRPPRPGPLRRRAGAALGRLRSRVRAEPALLRLLHDRNGDIEVDGSSASARTRASARRGSRRKVIRIPHPANRQPQRRPAPVRPRRDALPRHRRRRRRRRPARQRPEPRTCCSASCCGSTRRRARLPVPEDNPFVGAAGADEIYALGLRNPYRFSFDSRTGDIWIGDVGQDSCEEIDHARSPGARRELRLGHLRGQPRLRGPQATGRPATGARARVLVAGRRLRGHRRLRRPRPRAAGAQGRYVYADFCGGEIRSLDAPRIPGVDRRARPASRSTADLVRRGRRRPRLRHLARGRGLADRLG